MRDLSDPRLMYLKAALLLVICVVSSGLLLAANATLQNAALLALAIWSSCRVYYFAFYVIEHYIDPGFKFSGLGDFIVYLWKRARH